VLGRKNPYQIIRRFAHADPYNIPVKSTGITLALPNLTHWSLYLVLVVGIFFCHGSEPEVTSDQIYYIGRANEIIRLHAAGDYWRSYDASQAFPVALAYLHKITRSPIISLKLLLAINTLGYLVAFHVFMRWVSDSRPLGVLFSMLSALFISFGHTFWGFTEFTSALPRSLVVPFHILVVWFYLSRIDSPKRFATIPLLVVLSWLHFSSLHLLLVLLIFEGFHFVFNRQRASGRDGIFLIIALAVAYGIKRIGEHHGIAVTGYVHESLTMALHATPATQAAAWEVEIATYPWRNLPIPMATLLATAVSFGPMLFLALWSAWQRVRTGTISPVDRLMLLLAASVVVGAMGLQLVMAGLRRIVDVYPVNFEEIRAISLLVIPCIYFLCRLWESGSPGPRQLFRRGAIIAVCVIQPLSVIRQLPTSAKESVLQLAFDQKWLNPEDQVRTDFARSFLTMPAVKPRTYYSTLDVVAWLSDHASPSDKVITDREESHLTIAQPIGTAISGYHFDVSDPALVEWMALTARVRRTLATGDTSLVVALAREQGASYAIVPWAVDHAAYRNSFFSVLRID
jgi:hypothetical protein